MAGNKEFGKNLKRIRESCGYGQEKLAELVGIEYQTISRIETGMYFTSFDNLQKIATALKVPLKELFNFSENDLSKVELIEIILQNLNDFEKNELEIINSFVQNIKLFKNK